MEIRLTPEEKNELLVLRERQLLRQSRTDLMKFILAIRPDYEINWHHQFICDKLNEFVFGDLDRLMIFAPPRHGKSEIVSRMLPAFILGNFPDQSVIAASYSADLASKMNRDVQKIMLSPQYKALFPSVKLGGKGYMQTGELFELVGKRGYYRSAGVGGGITGMGMNFGLIDDPIKDASEANSKTFRDRLWDWYATTFSTRLEKKGKILITLTRWHNDDLSSRLLKLMSEDPSSEQFKIISFPAVKDDELNTDDPRAIGEVLWPNKYNDQVMDQVKKRVGSRVWASLYQQKPSPDEGNLIKREWWRYYRQAPSRFDQVLLSLDLAVKEKQTSDYTVMTVWGRVGANKYLLDMVRARIDFPTTCQTLINLCRKWPQAHKKLVEAKANGPALIQTLKKTVPGLVEIEPKADKVTRVNAISPDIEAGNVYIPDPSLYTWVHDFVEEFSAFPLSTHDDIVDSTSQAITEMRKAGISYTPMTGHSGQVFY